MKRLAALLAAALSGYVFTGCVAPLADAPLAAPPAPLPEVQSLAPAPGMVWVAGSWHWDGHDWAWIPGRWETRPPP